MLSKMIPHSMSVAVINVTAFSTASSEITTFKRSTVDTETQSPMLLSMLIARDDVPLILKKRPRRRGNRFVELFLTNISMLIVAMIA